MGLQTLAFQILNTKFPDDYFSADFINKHAHAKVADKRHATDTD